jgi:hypothetical protein
MRAMNHAGAGFSRTIRAALLIAFFYIEGKGRRTEDT